MRIVVKLGSSLLTTKDGLNSERIRQFAGQLANSPHKIVIVTSGAIATGMKKLGMKQKPPDISMQQALAAVGQSSLMREYEKAFDGKKILAQVLLTNYDFSERMRYLNVQNTLLTLMKRDIIPVINENDTVTVGDIRKLAFGDNDSLATHVAIAVYADLLIIFTDVEGLYTKNPKEAGAELIRVVEQISEKEFEMCSGANVVGKGGMLSKLNSAKKATEAGIKVIIANGTVENAVEQALDGKIGTTFMPIKKINPRKYWLAFASEPKGKLFINSGAEKAVLEEKRNLLPVGIVGSEGDFKKGDVVEILNEKRNVIAKGVTNYFSAEISKIKGLDEDMVFATLGYAYREAVSRASMVLMKGEKNGE
ncbi:MAG: glutamate 5-kinase [Candidatus Micrarchaeota archaeon]